MRTKTYLLSLPERLLRSVLGLGAGVVREAGEVALPESVRQSQLYQNVVDVTLRYAIEELGGVEGVYRARNKLPEGFLARRTAGNAVEAIGLVAFSASPVWVLAGLSDVCGLGRQLIPEIADALKAQGLLETDAQFTSVDQMLDGMERTSGRLAATVNTPPLDVKSLREEWRALREAAARLPPASLPSVDAIRGVWDDLKAESTRQNHTVFQTSSLMAISAVRALPDNVRWLSASAYVGAARTGQVLGASLLEDYRRTLRNIRETGYVAFAQRQLRPYLRACIAHFSPDRRTLTERALDRIRRRRRP